MSGLLQPLRWGLKGPVVKGQEVHDHDDMEISEVIRRRRAELGMSQADLAAAAGVGARQIRRYEAGQQQPVLSAAVAIADALGISVNELAYDRSRSTRRDGSVSSVVDAVQADPRLGTAERKMLLTFYDWLVQNRRTDR
jgi:transcriptional regulator with XRE-family HTH domain